MRWLTLRPWLGTVVRLALAAIWIWAAWSKLGSPRTFVQAVRAYDATPEWLSKGIGYGLPVLELCLGIVLVIGVAVRLAAVVSAALFVVFLIGLVQAAARGLQLECGCFGGGGQSAGGTQYTLDILRDVGLLVLAVYLVLWSQTRVSLDEFLARHDRVEAPSAKRMRSDDGRRKYNAMLEQRRKAARERALWVNGSLAVVVALVALIGVGVQANRAKIQGSLTATHASVANGVVFGKAAAATVDVYEDFQCPVCRTFEKGSGAAIQRLADEGKVKVVYYPFTVFASQPTPTAAGGFAVSLLVRLGRKAGITVPGFAQCVQSQRYAVQDLPLSNQIMNSGVTGMLTLKLNGEPLDPNLRSSQLRRQIMSASPGRTSGQAALRSARA